MANLYNSRNTLLLNGSRVLHASFDDLIIQLCRVPRIIEKSVDMYINFSLKEMT